MSVAMNIEWFSFYGWSLAWMFYGISKFVFHGKFCIVCEKWAVGFFLKKYL